MESVIDWDNAQEVFNFGVKENERIHGDWSKTDIRLCISILKHFPKRYNFTITDLCQHYKDCTKEKLAYILVQICDMINIIKKDGKCYFSIV